MSRISPGRGAYENAASFIFEGNLVYVVEEQIGVNETHILQCARYMGELLQLTFWCYCLE